MESKTNYTIVGLIVLILIAGLISFSLWLSIGFESKNYVYYLVYMNEAASGLNDDSPVKYNGVKVGLVNKIDLNPFDPQQVRLLLRIEEDTPVTIDTYATLINQGITGTTYLGLAASSPTLIPLPKTPGEPYPVIPYKTSFLNQLEQNLSDLSNGLKQLVDKENIKYIKTALHNIKDLTNVFAENKPNIQRTLEDIPKLIDNFKESSLKIRSMAENMSSASKSVSTTMQSGRNTIDKISQQAVPPAVLLLQKMDAIAANLEKLSSEMRQNPSVIIRGTTPPPPGPGE